MYETRFMKKAIQKAYRGLGKGQSPFGACIVKEGKIISCAHNRVWKKTDITAHAEMEAIRIACKKLKSIHLAGCVIYSTCEPCPMCFAACHWARISEIVYGAGIQDAQKIGFNELPVSNEFLKQTGQSPIQIRPGFLREENLELFKFFSEHHSERIY
jgi:guanine deaminase